MDRQLTDTWQQFLKKRFVAVTTSGGSDGRSLWVNIEGRRVSARCFGDVRSGECMALQLDSGEWLLVNSQVYQIEQYSSRNLELRRTKQKTKEYLVKSVFSYDFWTKAYLGGFTKFREIADISFEENFINLGFITNLGGKEYNINLQIIKNVSTSTGTPRKYLFKPSKSDPIIANNPFTSGFEFYLGNGLWESSARGVGTSPSVVSRATIVDGVIHTNSSAYSYTPVIRGSTTLLNVINSYADTWTPENSNSRFTFTRVLTDGRPVFEPSGLPTARYKESYSGRFLATKTTDGYIYQSVQIEKDISMVNSTRNSSLVEIENTLILKYAQKEIVLNTSDFLIFRTGNYLEEFPQQNSTDFTVLVSYEKPFGEDDFEIFSVDLSPFIRQRFIANLDVLFDGSFIPCLVKGTINSIVQTSININGERGFAINCLVENITSNIITSFRDNLITDNGSFFGYFLKNRRRRPLITKSTTPIILSPITRSARMANWDCLYYESTNGDFPNSDFIDSVSVFAPYSETTGLFLSDSIIGQDIYSVVQLSSTRAIIEWWKIDDEGNTSFIKTFNTKYYPTNLNYTPNGFRAQIASSFHP